MDKITVSIMEASKALSLGRSKIYELIQSGDLSTLKVGRRTLIPVASLNAFVNSKAA